MLGLFCFFLKLPRHFDRSMSVTIEVIFFLKIFINRFIEAPVTFQYYYRILKFERNFCKRVYKIIPKFPVTIEETFKEVEGEKDVK